MIERIRIAWYSRKLKRIPDNYEHYLQKYSDYYRALCPNLKYQFKKRLFISRQFLEFRPVEFAEVTDEMKILITSALVQMTFGFNRFVLRKFKTIYVVPNTYSYRQYGALLGHVDYSNNTIALSWPSVQQGFVIPDDAFNVALHELAHALQAENHQRFYFSKFYKDLDIIKFNEMGIGRLYEIREKRHTYLRDYAGNNMIEFFAVCVETFFEQSKEFSEKLPTLYKLMVNLFNQNPIKGRHPIKRK